MKKLILIALLSVISLGASAQIEAGTRFGLRLDQGISKLNGVSGTTAYFAYAYGLHGIVEFNTDDLYLQTGLGLQNMSFREEGIRYQMNAMFAQLPIHVGYYFMRDEPYSVFVQAGPTFGLGLWGWIDGHKVPYFSIAERFDVECGGRVGLEVKRFQVSVGYNYGILHMTDHLGGHHQSFNIGLGYMF